MTVKSTQRRKSGSDPDFRRRCAWAKNPLAIRYHDREWGVPVRLKRGARVPARTAVSDALSSDLRRRGFRFVGSTIMYAFMQATGMANDHAWGCFCAVKARR